MKRFRFSLLSLVVGVVLFSGPLYVNLRMPEVDVRYTSVRKMETWLYGWPFIAYREHLVASLVKSPPDPAGDGSCEWHWLRVAGNVVVGLVIAVLGGTVCEYLVRRRTKGAKT